MSEREVGPQTTSRRSFLRLAGTSPVAFAAVVIPSPDNHHPSESESESLNQIIIPILGLITGTIAGEMYGLSIARKRELESSSTRRKIVQDWLKTGALVGLATGIYASSVAGKK